MVNVFKLEGKQNQLGADQTFFAKDKGNTAALSQSFKTPLKKQAAHQSSTLINLIKFVAAT
jgi:hypothetical protein